jgi:hypothetical protein
MPYLNSIAANPILCTHPLQRPPQQISRIASSRCAVRTFPLPRLAASNASDVSCAISAFIYCHLPQAVVNLSPFHHIAMKYIGGGIRTALKARLRRRVMIQKPIDQEWCPSAAAGTVYANGMEASNGSQSAANRRLHLDYELPEKAIRVYIWKF